MDSEGKTQLYITEEDVLCIRFFLIKIFALTYITSYSWGNNHDLDAETPLRIEQLAFRSHEIYLAFAAFRKFVEECDEMHLRVLDADENIDKESWRNAVNCKENIAIMGHSFGGTTVVSHFVCLW